MYEEARYVSELYQKGESGSQESVVEKFRGSIHTIAMYYYRLVSGGVEKVISLLTPLYIEMGYRVVLLLEQVDEELDYQVPDGVKKCIIPSVSDVQKTNDYSRRAQKICEILEREKIDIVCHHASVSELLYYDILLCRLMKRGVVIVKHTLFAQNVIKFNADLSRYVSMYKLADVVAVLSETEKAFWDALGIRAEYIMNPMEEMDIEYSFPQDNRKMIWVGRLDDGQKQYLDAVEIMSLVHERMPEVRLEIYGAEYSVKSREKLLDAISDAGLEACAIYKGYTLNNREIYENAALHLVTSAFEAFPMNIYESKRWGIPLVTYDMPYLELLRTGGGHVAVEQGDVEGAAEEIINILSDQEYRKDLSVQAFESVSAFNNEEVKKRWKATFQGICSENAEPPKVNEYFYAILKTMLFHYERGYGNNFDYYIKEIKRFRRMNMVHHLKLVKESTHKIFAVYPYGQWGRIIHQMLLELFGEEEPVVLIDNNAGMRGETGVMTLEDFVRLDTDKYVILLCSKNQDSFESVRRDLYHLLPDGEVVDLYLELGGI